MTVQYSYFNLTKSSVIRGTDGNLDIEHWSHAFDFEASKNIFELLTVSKIMLTDAV